MHPVLALHRAGSSSTHREVECGLRSQMAWVYILALSPATVTLGKWPYPSVPHLPHLC